MNKLLLISASVLLLTACANSPTPTNPVTTPVASSPPPAPGKTANQLQTERLIGNWALTYKIINTFTNKYTLSRIAKSTSASTPDDYYIFGSDAYGTTIIAGYNSKLNKYALLDSSSTLDEFFIFDFTDTSHISGCAYLTIKSNGLESDCYAMTGLRSSATPIPLSLTRAHPTLSEVTFAASKARNTEDEALYQTLKNQLN